MVKFGQYVREGVEKNTVYIYILNWIDEEKIIYIIGYLECFPKCVCKRLQMKGVFDSRFKIQNSRFLFWCMSLAAHCAVLDLTCATPTQLP